MKDMNIVALVCEQTPSFPLLDLEQVIFGLMCILASLSKKLVCYSGTSSRLCLLSPSTDLPLSFSFDSSIGSIFYVTISF